tara:strand:- start:712 stop:1608 length:897 start_codon:yes stop_codon:yes gene_type:complete
MSENKPYTKNYWSNVYDDKYKWLFNYLKSCDLVRVGVNEDNYIFKLKNELKSIILNNGDWSLSSKELLLLMVYKWLVIRDDDMANTYKDEFVKIKQIRDFERGNNTQDKKEQENYKNLDYYKNILMNKDIEKLNKSEHMKYLLLSLLVYQPPLRTSFYNSVKFIFNKDENNNKDNYLLIENDKIYFIVNSDKVSVHASKENVIEIINVHLKNIILYSYDKYNRKYVLINKWNKNISQNTILIWLKEFTNSDINVNMMRSSYINNEYSGKLNYNEKNKLAEQMRHSINTAMKDYVKNDV